MKRTQEHKLLYTILGIGAFATFFGHGMWAIGAKESFVGLLRGTLDTVLGVSIGIGSAETVVRVIGWVDIAVSAAIALMVFGAVRERGSLYSAAYSRMAIALFSWGVVWGFATAFSRVTAAETWYPAFWDWVERAPNFMLPAALMYVIVRHRTIEVPTHVPSESQYVSR